MPVSDYDYRRRRAALNRRDDLYTHMQDQQFFANLAPDDACIQQRADEAAEAWLRNEEKIEYLDALIDASREPAKRLRQPDAPTPMKILADQQLAQHAREKARIAHRGIALPEPSKVLGAAPREINNLRTPEQLQAESDERRQKEADRAARRERRRLMKISYNRARRAKGSDHD